ANPIAGQRLGLAQTLLNARMPGAAAAERNIYGSQANTMAQVNRNATDSSQVLALAGAAQGQTNQAFSNLETQEAQDYQRRYSNLGFGMAGMGMFGGGTGGNIFGGGNKGGGGGGANTIINSMMPFIV